MDKKLKALIALLATVLLWSTSGIISKVTVYQVSPMYLSLLRIGTAAILFAPFILKSSPWKKPKFYELVGTSLFSCANVLLFIWGIQYTSASAGQLIYAMLPVLMVLANILLLNVKVSLGQIAGVFLGFAGLVYIVFLSYTEKGETISGGLIGNIAIMTAMFSWFIYILLSKKLTKYFTPVEIGGVSVIVTLGVNLPLAIAESVFYNKFSLWNLSSILGGIYLGVGGTFLAYIFYQYAIKNVSTLTVSLSSYIQPVTTAILASIFIGEKLTANFIFGSILVFSGIFLTTTLEVYKKRALSKN